MARSSLGWRDVDFFRIMSRYLEVKPLSSSFTSLCNTLTHQWLQRDAHSHRETGRSIIGTESSRDETGRGEPGIALSWDWGEGHR